MRQNLRSDSGTKKNIHPRCINVFNKKFTKNTVSISQRSKISIALTLIVNAHCIFYHAGLVCGTKSAQYWPTQCFVYFKVVLFACTYIFRTLRMLYGVAIYVVLTMHTQTCCEIMIELNYFKSLFISLLTRLTVIAML